MSYHSNKGKLKFRVTTYVDYIDDVGYAELTLNNMTIKRVDVPKDTDHTALEFSVLRAAERLEVEFAAAISRLVGGA